MATQIQLDKVYMDMAISISTISYGQRAKVGAVAVTANGVVITGVNGLPKALGNELELHVNFRRIERMCFLFKDVIEFRRKLLESREKGYEYVSQDCDPEKLELETRKQIINYMKQKEKEK